MSEQNIIPKPKRKVVPRAGIDRMAVVHAAVALIDREGLTALSLSRLASILSVRTPSLYNHVESLLDLRREIALYGLRELHQRILQATIGREKAHAVVGFAHAYRTFAKSHPGLYAVTAGALYFEYEELRTIQTDIVHSVVLILSGYGLSEDDALHAVRGLRSALHGFVTLEIAGLFGMPLDIDESFERLITTMTAGLSR